MKINGWFFLLWLLIASCGITDTFSPVPAYVKLEDPKVNTDQAQGASTHKITDAWVFQNGQIIGVYPLPAQVPLIVDEREQEILILAGIRNNGANDSPVFYPFYKSIQVIKKFEQSKTEKIPLEFSYIDQVKFNLIADFEQINLFGFDLDEKPSTGLVLSSDASASGQRSGKVSLDKENSFIEIATTDRILKSAGASGKSYIEMDYYGEAEIALGVISYQESGNTGGLEYKVVLRPQTSWNKVYVEVTEFINASSLKDFRIALAFSLPPGKDAAVCYIDNIKMVRF